MFHGGDLSYLMAKWRDLPQAKVWMVNELADHRQTIDFCWGGCAFRVGNDGLESALQLITHNVKPNVRLKNTAGDSGPGLIRMTWVRA